MRGERWEREGEGKGEGEEVKSVPVTLTRERATGRLGGCEKILSSPKERAIDLL